MRDIVVIGAPVGGAAALARVVSDLTADLDAAVFVVLHTRPDNPILLADVLNDQGGLRAVAAMDGERVEHGRIYVATGHDHLAMQSDRIQLVQNGGDGPRPSIDVLFASAARHYSTRVIGVVLVHCHQDGAHGLHQIRKAGGRTITHRSDEMAEPPRDPQLGEALSDDHLELAKIGKRVLHYTHGNGDGRPER